MEAPVQLYPWLKEKRAYWLWLNTAGRLLSALCRMKVEGRENIPSKGGVLIVSNHRSYLDPPLIAFAVKSRVVFFMAKAELFSHPILAPLIKHWGNAFPVDRGKIDTRALKTALKLIQFGKAVCIFPEGSRAPEGKFGKAKWGAGFTALKAKVPILPCLVEGTEKVMGRDSVFSGLPRVRVCFGKPFKLDMEGKRENYQRAADILITQQLQEVK